MRHFNQSMVIGTFSLVAFAAGTNAAHADCNLAFPTAEGAGRCATGGRGGDIYVVTTISSDATVAGSLPYGLANVPAGGRVIVFGISGVIDLTKTKSDGTKTGTSLNIPANVTIAGQTAPGDGITITGGALVVSSNNVIVRHVRSRRGVIQENADHGDAFTVKAPTTATSTTNVIVDHVSASWATDENLSIVDVTNTTAQWNINAQGLNYTNTSANPQNHGYGGIWSAHANSQAGLYHTLYAHNNRRNPHFGNYYTDGGGTPTVLDAPTMDFRDNIIYDWLDLPSHTNGSMFFDINFTNNLYKPGLSTLAPTIIFSFERLPTGADPANNTKMYAASNRLNSTDASTTTNMSYATGTSSNYQVSTAFTASPFNTVSIDNNYTEVLEGSGAILPARDIVDRTIVNDVRNGTGSVILKETDVWPSNWKDIYYESMTAPTDTDGDKLPDYWEQQFGGVALVANGTGTNTDNDADGYVNIEEYINSTIPISINGSAGSTPKNNVVYVGAMDSRAKYGSTTDLGVWRIYRTGSTNSALTVKFTVSDTTDVVFSASGTFNAPTSTTEGSVTIPAGAKYVDITLTANASTLAARQIRLDLATTGFKGHASLYQESSSGYPYFVGCPGQSMVKVAP